MDYYWIELLCGLVLIGIYVHRFIKNKKQSS